MATETLLSILVPIFALIGLGWLSVASGLLSEETGDALSNYVFMLAIPLLLFRSLGTLQLPEIDVLPYWATYFCGVALVWIAGTLVVRLRFGRDARAGVIAGISAGFSNLVFLGIPLFRGAYGPEGLIVGLVLVSVHLPVMMTTAIVLIDLAERRDGVSPGGGSALATAKRVISTLAVNPLVIAILAGLTFRASGLGLPDLAAAVIDKIAGTAIPVALVALGIGLSRYGIAGNVAPALVLAALKLFAMPAIVLFLGTVVFGLPPLVAAVATLAACLATGVNPYLIAVRFGTGHALASNTITITAIASVASTAFWLWVLGA